jgi:XRE family transcriptional regulator, regulator of sulfur utilization
MEGVRMMTRREIVMALAGAAVALAGTAVVPAARASVQGSTIFDWNEMKAQPTKVGAVRRLCQVPTATLDELEMHITTLNPGETSHPPHKHPDEELLIVKEGTVESLVNGEQRRVGPGSVIFQASNQMHGIRNVGDGPATYHVIRWNSPGMLKK